MIRIHHEIHVAVDMLTQSNEYGQLLQHFVERPNPRFSVTSYILYEIEDECLMTVINELEEQADSQPITLIFDGALVSCTVS